jgi:hypothetical protein
VGGVGVGVGCPMHPSSNKENITAIAAKIRFAFFMPIILIQKLSTLHII